MSCGKKIFSIFFVFLFAQTGAYTQSLETLKLDFKKTDQKSSGEQFTATGKIYHNFSDESVYLEVKDPVHQIISLKEGKFVIYYPRSNKAYITKNHTSLNMPFFEAVLSALKDDYGMSESNFTLDSTVIKGDTLTSLWDPTGKEEKILGKQKIVYVRDKIIGSYLYAKNGKLIASTRFKDHHKYQNQFIPLTIKIESNTGKFQLDQTVNYSNPKFNESIPGRIKSFRVPQDATKEYLEW